MRSHLLTRTPALGLLLGLTLPMFVAGQTGQGTPNPDKAVQHQHHHPSGGQPQA